MLIIGVSCLGCRLRFPTFYPSHHSFSLYSQGTTFIAAKRTDTPRRPLGAHLTPPPPPTHCHGIVATKQGADGISWEGPFLSGSVISALHSHAQKLVECRVLWHECFHLDQIPLVRSVSILHSDKPWMYTPTNGDAAANNFQRGVTGETCEPDASYSHHVYCVILLKGPVTILLLCK